MSLRKTILRVAAVAAALLATNAKADVSVTGVTAAQRYPWNGLVDIDYTVVCDDANADVYVFPEGTDNDTGALLQLKTLTGEGANGAVKAGAHRMTWDAAKDQPNFHSSSISVKITAIRGAAPYIVIDLSGGTNAASYPVRFSAAGPNLDDDTCRTTELWLRLILPGTCTMGTRASDFPGAKASGIHDVTLTKPFYMAVFESTQKQWELVMGTTPSKYKGDTRPVECVSYDDIRGSLVGANWPSHGQVDADSFFGKIRARTSLTLDLPTEAMWEYACRAGTTTALNNGKDLTDTMQCPEMAEVGRYGYNWNDGKGGYTSYHTKVGSYRPNDWGLYDMHGNVMEWCLDWYGMYYVTGAQTDPVGADSGSHRVYRGGCNGDPARNCLSADCSGYSLYSQSHSSIRFNYVGFRVACLPAE